MTQTALLDQTQVCKRYGVTRQALWAWRRKHGLPAIQIGRTLVFRPDELDRWEGEHKEKALLSVSRAIHITPRAPAVTQ